MGALLVFGAITNDVVRRERLTAMDLSFNAWIRAHATPFGDQVGVIISLLGGGTAMGILCLVVAVVFARRRWWIVLTGWVAAFVGGGALDYTLKRIIRRPRPVGAERFLHDATFSFPSGHSMGALIGFGMFAYVLIEFWPPAGRHRVLVVTLSSVMIVLVGLSRLYLGVHYPTDVVAGFAAGIVWLTACVTGVELAKLTKGETNEGRN